MYEIPSLYPDDDGEQKRAWVRNGEKRGTEACERVFQVLASRPWVIGEMTITDKNSLDDELGFDIFVPMDERLLQTLGIRQKKLGVPFQVKSNDHAVEKFMKHRKIVRQGELVFTEGDYIFTLNGQHAKDLILADMVGQMIVLSSEVMKETDFLDFLGAGMQDEDAVLRWIENRDLILDGWWYSHLIQPA